MIRFSVAEIFGNGMVLQRNKPIHIFGHAEEGDRVRVSIYDYHGRLIDEINSVSDRLEKWQVTLASMAEKSATMNRFPFSGTKAVRISSLSTSGTESYSDLTTP